MEILISLLMAALTFAIIVIVILALAALFMIVFSIAAGIDRRIQE